VIALSSSVQQVGYVLIEATQQKLREAIFFFDKLCKANQEVVRNDPEIFSYYLSAFLSAARSVTFALQFEEKEKYDAWFPVWHDRLAQEDKDLLKLFVAQRNQVLKQGTAEIDVVTELIPLTEVRQDRYEHPAYGFHWAGLPGDPPPQVGVSRSYFELDGSPSEVTSACERYVKLLQNLVPDFVRSHSGTENEN
jgi:hypothetical protein